MKAKLKSLKESFRPHRNDPVNLLRAPSMLALSGYDQNDKQRSIVETGHDALGLKELFPGHNPVIE
jgi:hypothetical protein